MFSTKLHSLKSPLNDEEKSRLRTLEYCIAPETQPERPLPTVQQRQQNLQFAEAQLADWRQETLVRFTLHSSVLQEFCATNEALKKKWVKEITEHNLQSQGYGTPASEIQAVDGSEKHSLFDHYKSEYFLNLYNLPRSERSTTEARDRAWLLNQAIQLGSFEAIAFRCSLTIENLLKTNVAPAERQLTLQQSELSEEKKILLEKMVEEKAEDIIQNSIFSDFRRLCQLYGAIGYLHIAKELYNLSEYFLLQEEADKKNRGQALFDHAVRNIICASLLSDEDYSNHLLLTITKGSGIAALGSIHALKTAKTWEDALLMMSSWYNDKAEFDQIKKDAKEEIRSRNEARSMLNQEQKVAEVAPSVYSLSVALAKLKAPLDENEKRIKNEFESALDSNHQNNHLLTPEQKLEKFNTAIINVSKWRQETIIRFSLKSDVLKNCFINNVSLQSKWLEALKERNKSNGDSFGIPEKEIIAVDESESHSLFDHYCSDYYLSLLKTTQDKEAKSELKLEDDILQEVAQLGAFEAIALNAMRIAKQCARSLPEEKKLAEKQNSLSKVEKAELLQVSYKARMAMLLTLEKELARLGKLYGSVGLVYSANLLQGLIPFYKAYPKILSILFKMAAVALLRAELQAGESHSLYAQEVILKKLNLFSLLSAPALKNIGSWAQAKDYLKENAPVFHLSYEEDLVRGALYDISQEAKRNQSSAQSGKK